MDTMPNHNAGQLLRQYSQNSVSPKWPEVWESELSLRLQMRQAMDWENLLPVSNAEIELLRRSFIYSGQTDKFWSIIFAELNSEVVQNWLVNTSEDLRHGFWNWLTAAISAHSYEPRQLAFLINMYTAEFRGNFQALIRLLNQNACEFLLARTSNLEFRDMLQSRLTSLASPDPWLEALTIAIPSNQRTFPTIFGDKLQCITAALKYFRRISPQSLLSSPQETMTSLWQGAQMLFRTGLLNDCLKLLSRIADPADEYQMAVRSDPIANRIQFERHLRRTLPIYVMLTAPTEPHRRCLDLIRSSFPGFSIEPASLLYLDLGAVLLADSQQKRPYTRYEVNKLAKEIAVHRSHDLAVKVLTGDQAPDKFANLVNEIKGRLETVPHESWVIMEIVLWLSRNRQIDLSRNLSLQLANLFEQFFAWIPAPAFSPRRLHSCLNSGAPVDVQNGIALDFPGYNLAQDDMADDTMGQVTMTGQRQRLLNKYLGVF